MFRTTATFLVIFLILNHEFAAARIVPQQIVKRRVRESRLDDEETGVEIHSRQKRSYGSIFRGLLAAAGTAGFIASVGSSVYQAIWGCRHYKPEHSRDAPCVYLKDNECPNIYTTPDVNRAYVSSEKDKLLKKMDELDIKQGQIFDVAVDSVSAALNNKFILTEINRINSDVDTMVFDLVDLDINATKNFRNDTLRLKSLLRNLRISINDIVVGAADSGMFDKWTWEHTFPFVLTIALPLGVVAFSYIKKQYVIRQMYKTLKADFANKFVNQHASQLGPTKTMSNKFAKLKGMSTANIDKSLKATAKAQYYAQSANQKLTKMQSFNQNFVQPLLNILVIGGAVFQIYTMDKNCKYVANDMQDRAYDMAEKAEELKKTEETIVKPLETNVTTQGWNPVRETLTNETTMEWLAGIKNLTENAFTKNATTIATLQFVMDNIASADRKTFIVLQKKLMEALQSIAYHVSCLTKKQHAITTLIKDCRAGRLPMKELYDEVTSKQGLNDQKCVDSKDVPYTTISQFQTIVDALSASQGWYSNCVLNNDLILRSACDEKLKGPVTAAQIVKTLNNSYVDAAMVTNYLTRCPTPTVTEENTNKTCKLWCLLEKPVDIGYSVLLRESQVNQIITATCEKRPCEMTDHQKSQICTLHFCNGENATVVAAKINKPPTAVQYHITNVCPQRCVLTSQQENVICTDSKCKGISATRIAYLMSLPKAAVDDTITRCDTIIPNCPEEPIDQETIDKVIKAYCVWGASLADVVFITSTPEATVKKIITKHCKQETCYRNTCQTFP